LTYILGISSYYHDSAVALIHNGKIIAAAQEERFTRIKHDPSFPKNSIKYVLKEASISLSQLESIVFYEKPFLKFERLLETHIAFSPFGYRSFLASMPIWLKEKLFQKTLIFNELKNIDPNYKDIKKIKFSEHHLSHASSAFYPSPFKEAIILTLDGVGEWATSTIGIGKDNKIKILEEIQFPHSIGLLYSAFTYYLGFKVNSGEYKVMGLAPYGNPKYTDIILKNLINVKEDGSFRLDMKYFNYATGLTMTNEKFNKLFEGKQRRDPEKDELNKFHMDIAASIQKVCEDIILKICKYIKSKYKINNICLAGGVALNCVANGKIIKNKIFDNIWVQPAAGDAGGSVGAALYYWYNNLNKNRDVFKDQMRGSYLGPQFSDDEISTDLKRLNANFKKVNENELYKIIAKELSDEKAVGWFQGRMEFGPRALGNRSIIADARSAKMQKNLNLKIKFREDFRPFAPAVIREKVSEYFKINYDSPYMLLVADVNDQIKINLDKEEKFSGINKVNEIRSTIPAVTHVDYSARVQTVHKETNLKFYNLIKEFESITKCSVLVNTSFNVRGEPIVCNIEDAFNCFMGTNIDILVIENFVLFKSDQDKKLANNYKDQFELD